MAHHVTESNPTHHIAVCGETCAVSEQPGWFHMCGKGAGHEDHHECGECLMAWIEITIVHETNRRYHFDGDEADEVWMDRP